MTLVCKITEGEPGPISGCPKTTATMSNAHLLAEKDPAKFYAETGMAVVVEGEKPAYDDVGQRLVSSLSFDGEHTVNRTWAVEDLPFEDVKTTVLDKLANARWQKETGGITYAIDGTDYTIYTDRESQSKMTAAFLTAAQGIRTDPSNWKTPEGIVPISNTEIQNVALAVMAHVQGCYDAEKLKVDEVNACETVSELLAVEIVV